jgi:hypothetical protein
MATSMRNESFSILRAAEKMAALRAWLIPGLKARGFA